MKKYFLFVIILLTVGYSNAQITITEADFTTQLAIGRQVTSFANFTLTTTNIGSPGSTSWDFSSLVSEAQFVTESKTKSSSTYSSDFPNAQYASYYEGTFSGVFSQSWVYNSIGPDFYTDGTGTFTSPSGINTTGKITFAPKKKQYQLPMTYNSTWNSSGTQTVATTIVLPFIGNQTTTLVQNYSVDNTVDGYGTVKMPGGKILSALRIKSVTSLTTNSQTTTTVNYLILTKTGESVSITVKDANSTSGAVAIDAISWTNGDGVSNPSTNTVTTSSSPSNGGTTSGGGTPNSGSSVTVIATPNSGFSFTNWTENGTVLSESASYTFTVSSNRTLVANFSSNTSIEQVGELPTKFALSQNYPNPFNPTTMIQFSIPKESMVRLSVYNSLGQEIVKLVDQELNTGIYSVSFDASKLSSGIYFYKVKAGNFYSTKKMILMK